jgi:hypothetical protein
MLVITREADPSMACSDERAIMQRISAQPQVGGDWGGLESRNLLEGTK